MADPILKTYGHQATQHFERAAAALALRQMAEGRGRGNVGPWSGCGDFDFHGTLSAIWVWARHQALSGDDRFAANRIAGWTFIESEWRNFIPEAIGPAASDEAAYDCAMVLRADLAERVISGGATERVGLVAGAAHVLAAHLAALEDLSGRDFQDPGFLAWNLIDHARAIEDRGLLSVGRGFVEHAFGMKAPPAFTSEPDAPGRLFDFSSTTATRVLAVISSEGQTPFVGAWLRERVIAAIPDGFVARARDENCWNACAATVIGRAYAVSTDPVFLAAYRVICTELTRRDNITDLGLGRQGDSAASVAGPDTLVTFFHALAADALVRTEGAAAEVASREALGRP